MHATPAAVGGRQTESTDEQHAAAPGGALREYREHAKLTQHELAERAEVDEKTIRRIELHPERFNAKFQTLKRIAEALGDALGMRIDPHELLGKEAPRLNENDPINPEAVDRSRLPVDQAVLFIWDLATLLRCSPRTLKRILAFRPWDLPAELPSSIDQRRRWARATVIRWLEGDPTAAGKRPDNARRRQLRAVSKSRGSRSSEAHA